jgi:hypothetical protein
MTEIGHQSNFKLDNQLLKLAKHLHSKNVLLLHHTIIFIKLGACAETISQNESKFIIKFKQKYIDKNPTFILDYNHIGNSCVLALKFKQNPHGLWFCLQFQGFQFSNWPLIQFQ